MRIRGLIAAGLMGGLASCSVYVNAPEPRLSDPREKTEEDDKNKKDGQDEEASNKAAEVSDKQNEGDAGSEDENKPGEAGKEAKQQEDKTDTEVSTPSDSKPSNNEMVLNLGETLDWDRFLSEYNDYRQTQGKRAGIEYDRCLQKMAIYWAEYHRSLGVSMRHADEDNDLKSRYDRFRCDHSTVAENLALRFDMNPRDLLQQWIDSPGHRKNLLKDGVTHIGLSCVKGEKVENAGHVQQCVTTRDGETYCTKFPLPDNKVPRKVICVQVLGKKE
jgi:uncharacterized protein YkwD